MADDTGAGTSTELEATNIDEDADHDKRVPWRVFLTIGGILAVMALIYAPSGERAGTAMLTVAAVLGLWCGVFLYRNGRRLESPGAVDAAHAGEEAVYLPAASPWPVGIGLGLALVLNGLIIGTWFLVPGVMVLALSIGGWSRQSRHRT